MYRFRKIVFIFMSLALAVCLISCKARKQYVIGVSQCSEDNWRDKLKSELEQCSYLYDDVELCIVSADDNDRRQVAQIDSLVAAGIDLLIVSPNQMNTVTDAIDRAYDKGIPVVLFDRKTDSGKYTAFIGADNYEVGRSLANYIVAQVGDNKVNVVEIQGLCGSSPTVERHRGFMDVVKNCPGINVVASRYAGWLQEEARVQMDGILTDCNDIDIVFGHNDRMAVGAREAVEGIGLKRDILYLGVDALASSGGGMEAVSKGKIAASYLYPTRGDLVLQLAMNILEDQPYDRDNYLKAALVTRDNVKQMLMQNEEMESQTRRLEAVHKKVDAYLAQYTHQKIYFILVFAILVIVVLFFVYIYRTVALKHRMAEEAADAKLQFFTNVSHDFRTPLTLIADPVERLLEDGSLTLEQRSLLNVVHKNVNVVLRLVREILDFRKTQKGKMQLMLSEFDIRESLREWTECFTSALERRDIDLQFDVEEGLVMKADYEKIESVFYNLLSNAIKYTPKGGTVRISAVRNESNVVLKVADNGAGIPKECLRQVFDRFFQAGNSNVGGTGIGLAIVKAFAELHGGSVSVESEEGRGTEFIVTLPAGDVTGVACDISKDRDVHKDEYALWGMTVEKGSLHKDFLGFTDTDGERMKILIVDDNEDVRGYIASVLSVGYDIVEAADGKSGFDRAMREVPNLIVSDIMMPVMDGTEMCRRIKSETATSHIPVLMLTAGAQEEQRAEAYGCGADAYITKPFSSRILLLRIKNLLENRRKLRERYSSGDVTDEAVVDPDSLFVSSLRDKIKSHMSDSDFSVETLSSEMGLSRVQLYRKVKAITDHTPVELIRIMRLQRAEHLLRTGGKTVAEVSYSVGFSSPSYFSKCFKEYFGKLPGEI